MVRFFLSLIPSRTTAQQAKITVKGGKPRKYMPEALKDVKALYMAYLSQHIPQQPLEGPLYLRVDWYFSTKSKKQDKLWKDTTPDTDNLNKLFKDCMTECGYWKDDSQVVYEVITKSWSYDRPGISVMIQEIGPYIGTGKETADQQK